MELIKGRNVVSLFWFRTIKKPSVLLYKTIKQLPFRIIIVVNIRDIGYRCLGGFKFNNLMVNYFSYTGINNV